MTAVDKVLADAYRFENNVTPPLDRAQFTTGQAYLNARIAPARALGYDRHSVVVANNPVSATAPRGTHIGFGFAVSYDPVTGRVVVRETYEAGPAFGAGIDRGGEISAIGMTAASMRSTSSIFAEEGISGLAAAFGPREAGVTRAIRFTDSSGTRDVSLSKATFLIPVHSPRYGFVTITEGGEKFGYINSRSLSVGGNDGRVDPNNIGRMLSFYQDNNISKFIVDLRYDSGSGSNSADVLAFAAVIRLGRRIGDFVIYQGNSRHRVLDGARDLQESINATRTDRIVFIVSRNTSANSELFTSAFRLQFPGNASIVGSNTAGKHTTDWVENVRASSAVPCDRKIFVPYQTMISAAGVSPREVSNFEELKSGMAGQFPNSCAAEDDVRFPMGDRREASTRAAIDFLAGRACTTRMPTGLTPAANELVVIKSALPSESEIHFPGMF